MIIDRTAIRIDPAHERGSYSLWIGFFSGWEPSWRDLSPSAAPSELRDVHHRYRLTTIDLGH